MNKQALEKKTVKKSPQRRDTVAPASDIQLSLLNSRGVESLADLSREEAQGIIDGILRQEGRKIDGQLLLTKD